MARPSQHLGRRLLVLAGITGWPLMFSSCLITSTPEFGEPARSAPFLIAEGALPNVREFVRINPTDRISFSATVRSEDDEAPVEGRLFIDYGTTNFEGQPFFAQREGAPLPPSTFDDTTRTFKVDFVEGSPELDVGCHRFTIIVSHDFDFTGCPTDIEDSSTLTWFGIKCDGPCPEDINPLTDCPPATASCDGPLGAGGAGGAP